MKKLFFISLFFAFAISLSAQEPEITVFSEDGNKFWFILDGKKINEEPQYRVEKVKIEAGFGRAKIVFQNPDLPQIDKNVQAVNYDNKPSHFIYKIKKKNNGKYVLRISSFEEYETSTAYNTTVNNEPINQGQTGNVQQQVDNGQNTTHATGLNVDFDENGIKMNVTVDEQEVTTEVNQQTTEPKVKLPSPDPLPGYNGAIGCRNPMANQSFQAALQTIKAKSFEDSKLTIAKQIANSNCLLSIQVKHILDIFSFEDDKLEFAKHAYHHTYDIGNYFQVNDAFDFESSIDELNEYISTQ